MKTTLVAAVIVVSIVGVCYWLGYQKGAVSPDGQANVAVEKEKGREEDNRTTAKVIPPAKVLEQPPAPTHKVTLEVRARTWRKDPPMDIAKDLTERLLKAGIQVVPKGQKADAMLLAEYAEEKGEAYRGTYGLGPEAGFGTAISLKLIVLSPAGDTLLTLSASAHTPYSVQGDKPLHEAAWEEFQSDASYSHVQDFVGSALGIKASLSKLVPAVLWLDSRKSALALLERQKYQPADDAEKAMFAIAREDYAQCLMIGKAAVDPLLLFLDKYGYAEQVQKAARTLGEIGDPRAAEGLLKKLRYYVMVEHLADPPQQFSTSRPDRKAAVAVIEALGKVADGFALGDLEPLAASADPDIAAAAKQAMARIRERLKGYSDTSARPTSIPWPPVV